MKKIISKGNQVFNVPNTEEGKKFLELAKKFKHKGVQLRKRGRGKRVFDAPDDGRTYYKGKIRYWDGLPLDKSEWIALYLNGKDGASLASLSYFKERYNNCYEALNTISKYFGNHSWWTSSIAEEIINKAKALYSRIDELENEKALVEAENETLTGHLDKLVEIHGVEDYSEAVVQSSFNHDELLEENDSGLATLHRNEIEKLTNNLKNNQRMNGKLLENNSKLRKENESLRKRLELSHKAMPKDMPYNGSKDYWQGLAKRLASILNDTIQYGK